MAPVGGSALRRLTAETAISLDNAHNKVSSWDFEVWDDPLEQTGGGIFGRSRR